jgi:hypothetical protein
LPQILKDESKPVKKEITTKIFFEEDDDRDPENEEDRYIGRLRRNQWLQIIYPIKPSVRIEEVLKRNAGWAESSSVEYASARYRCDSIEIQSPALFENDTEKSEKKMMELVTEIEEKLAEKNRVVESYNYSFPIWLTDYLEKFKKLILKEREDQNIRSKSSVAKESGNDFDQDDDYYDECGRTANDDRSDSLNPNNSAYQAAQDNHSNQLNPNNSRYQGD